MFSKNEAADAIFRCRPTEVHADDKRQVPAIQVCIHTATVAFLNSLVSKNGCCKSAQVQAHHEHSFHECHAVKNKVGHLRLLIAHWCHCAAFVAVCQIVEAFLQSYIWLNVIFLQIIKINMYLKINSKPLHPQSSFYM